VNGWEGRGKRIYTTRGTFTKWISGGRGGESTGKDFGVQLRLLILIYSRSGEERGQKRRASKAGGAFGRDWAGSSGSLGGRCEGGSKTTIEPVIYWESRGEMYRLGGSEKDRDMKRGGEFLRGLGGH